ncbi:MAG: YbaB/EbfC family nucleoid-associated protein [Oscillospiraceae bacterium]|nr:YbaB/EbfC family nucleoid-associated protein [Oscillospiraceae bacterium]MBR0452179.1 YbaB/EbfC family nucleoid-associated protein [Oscillospiraceae bacterium]
MKARLPEGYGKQSRNQMLEKLNKMQADMEAKQEELNAKEYTATSGGGMVEATVNGKHRVLSVVIKPEVCDPDDTDMLGDLVAAAINTAIENASKDYDESMGQLTGGLNIPGLI